MNTKILLTCAALLAVASFASAEQVQYTDPVTGESVTTRVPGSLPVVPERETIESFEPMPAPRLPCDMVITSQPVEAPRFSSFARMPDTRHPRVACSPEPVAVQAVFVPEPAPYVPPPPVPEPMPLQPAPPPPVIEELPHTASLLPLIGLLGLLALGGAAVIRFGRSRLA